MATLKVETTKHIAKDLFGVISSLFDGVPEMEKVVKPVSKKKLNSLKKSAAKAVKKLKKAEAARDIAKAELTAATTPVIVTEASTTTKAEEVAVWTPASVSAWYDANGLVGFQEATGPVDEAFGRAVLQEFGERMMKVQDPFRSNAVENGGVDIVFLQYVLDTMDAHCRNPGTVEGVIDFYKARRQEMDEELHHDVAQMTDRAKRAFDLLPMVVELHETKKALRAAVAGHQERGPVVDVDAFKPAAAAQQRRHGGRRGATEIDRD